MAAKRATHGACEILENPTHWESLSAALADIDFSIATTTRSRAKFRYCAMQQQVQTVLEDKQHWVNSAALVFGRDEDSGLTNEALVDLLTSITMAADYTSLNLGQAVMVYCYQLSALRQVSVQMALLQRSGDGKLMPL
ncbi:spoU rRNA Methylase family protein, partial [Candidatus Erwinia dacicola]